MIFSPYRYPPAPIDASQVEYTPAHLTDWGDTDPGRVKQALDVLAARGVGDGSLTANELAAIQNAATAPTETNPFLTVADLLPIWTLDVVYWENEVVVNPTHGIYRCISGGSMAVLGNKPGVGEDWEIVWELIFEGGAAPAGSGGIDVWLPPVGEGVEYALGDFTVYDGALYHCIVAHTSSAATTPGTGEDWKTVWELVLSPVTDAADVTYTPTTAADWSGNADPGDLDDALDQLASRLATVEAGNEHRSDWIDPYNYLGTAPANTAEDATGWTVTRLQVSALGAVTTTTGTGKWSEREILVYA